jgi:alpha-amylase
MPGTSRIRLLALIFLFIHAGYSIHAQVDHHVKKTVFQAFWWDYWNNNYPNAWANYLVDLAPRLKEMGVDAVWIPPTIKNQDFGQKGVGYAPFDHYDLGDKYQKWGATTRVGTKDELLRMIAVMHANGIEVIQDIVPNHVIGAGSDTGDGGEDPEAPDAVCPNWDGPDKWKNFRYTSWATPALNNSDTNYLARSGRWPKNYWNFHPITCDGWCNLCDPNDDPICWQGFGPDVAYNDCAIGLSSNASYNPDQASYSPYNNGGVTPNNGYMRKHFREWLIWYKKQTGFNGVRIDAVKHFPNSVSEDFLWNLQNGALWASGTDTMIAVGEWVGDAAALDGWTSAVQNRAGTFDFSLRGFHADGGLRDMIYGSGNFNMSILPAAQQNIRYVDIDGNRIHRTMPFINNHDTYRPQFDANGNISGWNVNDQLAPEVDIREPRLGAAYAIMHAMDGNPQPFIEEVFNKANTSQRFTHDPRNTSQLPVNSDLANIIFLHGALDFKSGEYRVPSSIGSFWNVITGNTNNNNVIVIERAAKAIIVATDQWNQDQECWVDTEFPVGTVLKDYSGGIATTTTVQTPQFSGGPNRANVRCRAVGWPSFSYQTNYTDHGVHYHGYAIWAPVDMQETVDNYSKPALKTYQEWEMEDDLGDSHCESLVQGGRLPANSCAYRIVGKIFPKANSTVDYEFYVDPVSTGIDNCLEFYHLNGNKIYCNCEEGNFSGSFSVDSTGWVVAKIRHNPGDGCNQLFTCGGNEDCDGIPSQKAFVKLGYFAPADVQSLDYPAQPEDAAVFWTGAAEDSDYSNPSNWETCKMPVTKDDKLIIFVNQNAQGLNNGTSWQNAYTSLEKAFAHAAYCQEFDEIWVAEGTYLPNSSDDRNISFILPEGVPIYGGFPSVGDPDWADRDFDTYHSILSADIGLQGVATDNTFHVVRMPESSQQTILDGFQIKYGYANGNNNFDNQVGGILNQGILRLANIIISDCFADNGPSAILNTGSTAVMEVSMLRVENNDSPVGEFVRNENQAIFTVMESNVIKD